MKRIWDILTGFRFAVAVIFVLLGASAAGWVFSELISPDLPYKTEMYRTRWGDSLVETALFFNLYDPFHSFWYRGILGLFFVVLFLCVFMRWKRFIIRSFRISPPRGSGDFDKKEPRLEIFWSDLKRGSDSRDVLSQLEKRYGRKESVNGETIKVLFRRVSELLRSRGYHVVTDERDEEIFFAAFTGRLRFFGNLLFHVGIVVITVGAMMGSFWGETEVLYGRPGDLLPLQGRSLSVLVRDFRIVSSGRTGAADYISSVSILDEGADTLINADVKVNHPLRFGGYCIYQSSYYIDDEEFSWARIEFVSMEGFIKKRLVIVPDEEFSLEGTSFTIRAKRFFPDFRKSAGRYYSASANMDNPALSVELSTDGKSERGWLFLYYPRHNTRFEFPVRLELVEIEPVFYTGLQISTNPGAPFFVAGIIAATVGVILLCMFNYRSIKGVAGHERLVIVGTEYGLKVGFGNEFERLGKALKSELYDILTGGARW